MYNRGSKEIYVLEREWLIDMKNDYNKDKDEFDFTIEGAEDLLKDRKHREEDSKVQNNVVIKNIQEKIKAVRKIKLSKKTKTAVAIVAFAGACALMSCAVSSNFFQNDNDKEITIDLEDNEADLKRLEEIEQEEADIALEKTTIENRLEEITDLLKANLKEKNDFLKRQDSIDAKLEELMKRSKVDPEEIENLSVQANNLKKKMEDNEKEFNALTKEQEELQNRYKELLEREEVLEKEKEAIQNKLSETNVNTDSKNDTGDREDKNEDEHETSKPIGTTEPHPTVTTGKTPEPTSGKTPEPTSGKTPEPTSGKTPEPTSGKTPEPTSAPTEAPTQAPTEAPTQAPTEAPTVAPIPSDPPIERPTPVIPEEKPTIAPEEPEPTIDPGDWEEVPAIKPEDNSSDGNTPEEIENGDIETAMLKRIEIMNKKQALLNERLNLEYWENVVSSFESEENRLVLDYNQHKI